MTKLSITPPTTGELNSTADPKVVTALKAVETWANGEVGTANIAAENVTEAMLTKALQEKLTVRLGFTFKAETLSFNAESERHYLLNKTGITATLPAPTANRIISLFSGLGVTSKVTASSGTIYGDFINAQATIELLPLQHVILIAGGSEWQIIAGEPSRTATYSAVKAVRTALTEYEPSATRPTLVILSVKKPTNAFVVVVNGWVSPKPTAPAKS